LLSQADLLFTLNAHGNNRRIIRERAGSKRSILERKEPRECLVLLVDPERGKGTPSVAVDGSPEAEMRRSFKCDV
jgi:hypothetical protein